MEGSGWEKGCLSMKARVSESRLRTEGGPLEEPLPRREREGWELLRRKRLLGELAGALLELRECRVGPGL